MTDLSINTSSSINHGVRNLAMPSLGHFVNAGTVFFFPLLVDILMKVTTESIIIE